MDKNIFDNLIKNLPPPHSYQSATLKTKKNGTKKWVWSRVIPSDWIAKYGIGNTPRKERKPYPESAKAALRESQLLRRQREREERLRCELATGQKNTQA